MVDHARNVIKAALAAQVMRHGGLIRTVEHRAGRSAGLRRLLCKAEAREGFLIRRIERQGAAAQQVERLSRIGMYWGNRNDRKWNEGYQEAKRYFDAHGDLNVPAEYVSPGGYNLGNWVKRQRYTRQNPEKSGAVLTEERIAKLDEIGMRWGKSNPKHPSKQAAQAERVTAKAG